jgi:hypothetical protein
MLKHVIWLSMAASNEELEAVHVRYGCMHSVKCNWEIVAHSSETACRSPRSHQQQDGSGRCENKSQLSGI